jgi:hypothetical protein
MFFFNFFFLAKSTVYKERKYPKKSNFFFGLVLIMAILKIHFLSPPIFSAADFSKALRLLLMTILLLTHAHICKTPQQVSDGVMGNFFQKIPTVVIKIQLYIPILRPKYNLRQSLTCFFSLKKKHT